MKIETIKPIWLTLLLVLSFILPLLGWLPLVYLYSQRKDPAMQGMEKTLKLAAGVQVGYLVILAAIFYFFAPIHD
ncbi:hypothetical protein ACXO64_06495 [Lactobacillus delbrueckii subsp. bulgaricus]|uniref:hypothetical protein n=1 Tax=Lactobacillus delbrueckii TaxID=1584 RepID=UPI001BFF99C6|nr:hypothetical protein [Lactobacillus delbrueckii]MBT8819521.1 hypothetical protein [Lactobacillus delbrueckii subsp. bulgaricus]MBT8820938.1 hypothetical protein [Lactobacillus delbrueckii subsp. bulgaricus]MBT8824166.1 hypothetical protein [Lactobacillus delbrueckii subsp. bulgaricus]MBT8830737.1 hypothetical protein [Lactobacillus delbrueckii subsp. bulgaricus]MBT8835309.1 hypothetical protein [Lactobacillus delbrueckii subsp. bulgaricus]